MFSALRLCVTVCKVHLAFSPLRYKKLGFFLSRQLEGRSDNTAAQLFADSTYFLSIKSGLKTHHAQNNHP